MSNHVKQLKMGRNRRRGLRLRRAFAAEIVTLRQPIWVAIGYALTGLMMGLGSLGLLISEPSLKALGIAAMFVPFGVWTTLAIFPGKAYTRVSPDGIMLRRPFGTRHLKWDEIWSFHRSEIYTPHGFSLKRVTIATYGPLEPPPKLFRLFPWLPRKRGSVELMIPTYGFNAEGLARKLESLRKRNSSAEREPILDWLEVPEEELNVDESRLPLVTTALLAVCLAFYLNCALRFGLSPTPEELYSAGGAIWPDVTSGDGGSAWHLLTANLIHGNPEHIFFNLIALGLLGWFLEREIGWARMLLLTTAGGVFATFCALLLARHAVVVGISGVIFAIGGFALRRDRRSVRVLGVVAWSIVPVGLVMSFRPGVAIGGHLGGVVFGFLAADLAARRAKAARPAVTA